MSKNYEFTEAENSIFTIFNVRSLVLSIIISAIAIVGILNFFINDENLLYLAIIIMTGVIGLSFYLPVRHFKKVVDTKGKDISHLIGGIRTLTNSWFTLALFLVINRLLLLLNLLTL